jgi:hypothetical protein
LRKEGLLLAAVAVVFLILGFWFYSELKIDAPEALVFGERYFTNLQKGRINDAFEMYSVDFRRKEGASWRDIIDRFDARNGAIKKFKVLDAPIGSVNLPGSIVAGCTIVPFKVVRRNVSSEERLTIVCNDSGGCTIVGHEIDRLDNGVHLVAGFPGVEMRRR